MKFIYDKLNSNLSHMKKINKSDNLSIKFPPLSNKLLNSKCKNKKKPQL